ncbi:hypothetical protein KFK09_016249 [Dendrobium nobile]|uniref:Uncharacterized protein n=1 Tax=Dendrobium nobile TaxID=94219 RepID=A0A8T3B492_DENNO|nr:hypothetical protein KFK09_016249 [Dendrobium nobile]
MCLTLRTAISRTVSSDENGSASSENQLFPNFSRLSLSSADIFVLFHFLSPPNELKTALKTSDRPGRSPDRPRTIRPNWIVLDGSQNYSQADIFYSADRPGRCPQSAWTICTENHLEQNWANSGAKFH